MSVPNLRGVAYLPTKLRSACAAPPALGGVCRVQIDESRETVNDYNDHVVPVFIEGKAFNVIYTDFVPEAVRRGRER